MSHVCSLVGSNGEVSGLLWRSDNVVIIVRTNDVATKKDQFLREAFEKYSRVIPPKL